MIGIQEMLAALPDDEFAAAFREIMEGARELGLNGFGGGCFAAAVGIHRAVFGGTGELSAGLNVALWQEASHAIGHAAVNVRGTFWDADGRAKESEDIESWGMLDPEDSDMAETFSEHGLDWNDETAAEAAIWTFDDEAEFSFAFGCSEDADEAENVVAEAAARWAARRASGPSVA